MPHFIIEHSATIDGDQLIPPLFEAGLESQLFMPDGSDIKMRAQSFDHYQTGTENYDFIHVTLKVLSDRNVEDKSMLSNLVAKRLKSLELPNCLITIEVQDMDRKSYQKFFS